MQKKVENSIIDIEKSFASIKTIKELSKKHDINNVSLNKAIKQKTGMTAAQYLKDIRLREVLQLIQFTQLPITEIVLRPDTKILKIFRNNLQRNTVSLLRTVA